ncbi:uncharacterized protein DUF2795 [Geodermatophilus tzadiensis]|uniref:Uncharacterized protein DUF2795 n=1 Tax=Geodermatophilus tzadiensis TaxID=1137988 RepID=A0A2T0TWP2_9ACTN|nr:DUF2795 domain-containing protein [Geodermatophilus tzadiensis]PRY50050.1 uncharacterized protein DUF2795 [Geodermatophilus tzadiensis]
MAHAVPPQDVVAHLGEVDYPADKDALLAAAERHGAPDEVLRALRTVPPGTDYAHADEVVRALGPASDPGEDPTHAAEAARADARAAFTGHPADDDGPGAG